MHEVLVVTYFFGHFYMKLAKIRDFFYVLLARNYETVRIRSEKNKTEAVPSVTFCSLPNLAVLGRNLTFFLWSVSSETGQKFLNVFCFFASKNETGCGFMYETG